LHNLSQEGAVLVETHASTANTPALSLFTKPGFETVEHGTAFRKPSSNAHNRAIEPKTGIHVRRRDR
jgi:hypothetical protein